MEKSIFAGLSILDPGESIASDNGAFTNRDRIEIDRGLQIGIKTHRHDGTAGLLDPSVAPSGDIIASGGQIPGGLGISVGYTLLDEDFGETLISPTDLVTTPGPLSVPTVAPLAVFSSSAGALLIDTYTYAITYTDGEGGETPVGPSITVDRPPGFPEGQIELSGLDAEMAEAGADGWRLYRARGGGQYVLLTTGVEGEDTFVDDGSLSPDCDTHPPTDNTNTTNQINTLKVTIPNDLLTKEATFINLYASLTGDFGENSLLAQVPVASAGATAFFSSLDLIPGQPPDVNRSYGGASQIDPDTDILDMHWKRPVETAAELPAEAEHGDVRMVLDEDRAYEFNEDDEWVPLLGALPTVRASGSLEVEQVEDLEFVGSGGITITETEPGAGKARVLFTGQKALLAQAGMGVIVIKTSEKGIARPTDFKQYTWFCKEEPTNLGAFDIWIEEGP